MTLTLNIISGPPMEPGAPRSHTWHQRGGTLGRAGNNDWTLPDPEQNISRCHARVRYQQGGYFLEDTSTNGILLADGVTLMDSAELHPLRDGEEFGIGGYRIRVHIGSEPFVTVPPIEPLAFGGVHPVGIHDEAPLDPLALLGGRVEAPIEPLPVPPAHQSYLNEHFDPPAFQAPPIEIPAIPPSSNPPPASGSGGSPLLPDDWWTQPPAASAPAPAAALPEAPAAPAATPFITSPPIAEPPSVPVPPPVITASPIAEPHPAPVPPPAPPPMAPLQTVSATAPAASSAAHLPGDGLRELLRGAGLDPERLPTEIAEDLGSILRIAVQGVMDLMRARAEIKNEFRMSVTMIQASDNNPLKFSTSVEDALNNLLVKRNPSYLSAVEAFDSGFQDLRFHQVALLSGMREAFFEMLRQLDPETLEKRFQEQAQGSVLGRIAGPKPWDQYKHLFAEIHRDTEGYFNRLFGETFVAAYERRMQELQQSAKRQG